MTTVTRRDLLKAVAACTAGLSLAEWRAVPLGPAARQAWATTLPQVQPGDVPDAVLLNTRIHTFEEPHRTVEALAITNGRVQALGDTATIRALAGPRTVQYDLAGLTVVPGFYDSHNHLRATGLNFFAVDLSGARSIADVLAAIAARAAITPPGEWIVASSRWHEGGLAERRFPTRAELDAVAPNHPVYIPRGGHNVVTNSLGFARAGIDETTPNPPGGTYVRDPSTGELTGHIIGRPAFGRLARLLPAPTPEQEREALRAAIRAYHAVGITSVIEPGLEPAEFAGFQALWAAGELTVRTTAMLRVFPGTTDAELTRALDTIRGLAFATGFGDQWLRLGGIKFTADGGVETSYLREPFAYADDPEEPRGKPHASLENMIAVCALASALGWQMGVHCVGDAGIDLVLDAFEAVHARSPLQGKRWTLIHMMLARPEHFVRARAMDLVITAQQSLTYALSAGWVKYWGRERAANNEPLRAYLESGLVVGNGTDSPVTPYDPLLNLWSCATRETQFEGVLGPEWAISLADALRWYTHGSAYAAFEEQAKGSLAVGKLADLAALTVDPLAAAPEEVRDAQVLLTMVGGRVVHDGRPGSVLAPQRVARGFAVPAGCHCAEAPG
ncbi:MAG TPA: amidohydrolase [Chloroflexota bacterium]|jgi:predicted amidohydrolase YtcJ|nr:amidohydrolase [Chloroflexota bacterium]